MNILRKKTMVILSIILLLVGVFGWIYFRKKSYQSDSSHPSWTLLSHNVTSRANPMAYTTTLEAFADPTITSDQELLTAAKQLLDIDRNNQTNYCGYEKKALYKALYDLLDAYFQVLRDEPVEALEINKELEDVLFNRSDDLSSEDTFLRFSNTAFHRFDETNRRLGITRFSPLYYDPKMIEWMQEEREKLDIKAFTKKWIDWVVPHLKQWLPEGDKGKEEDRAFRKEYLLNFIFDLHNTQRLFDHQGRAAWVALVKKLQQSALADRSVRDRMLTALYKAQDASIICLQSCDAALIEALSLEGYFCPFLPTHLGEKSPVERAVILYKKSLFAPDHVKVIDIAHLQHYNLEEMESHSMLLENFSQGRLELHQVAHRGQSWLVCSFHASSERSDMIPTMKELLSLKKKVEQEEGKEVLLLVGLTTDRSDTPTVIEPRSEEEEFAKLDKLLEKLGEGSLRVRYRDGNRVTIHKKYSTFQVHLAKKHLFFRGIYDALVVSKQVASLQGSKPYVMREEATYLSVPGPDLKENPCEHSFSALRFTLEEVDD